MTSPCESWPVPPVTLPRTTWFAGRRDAAEVAHPHNGYYAVYALLLPNIAAILASSQEWFRDLQPWVDLNFAQGALFTGTLTGEQWANLAVTASVWLVLPALLGLRLVMRSEVK